MWSALLTRTRSHYPILALLLTRLVATLGGLLTIVYVHLTGAIPNEVESAWQKIAFWAVMAAVVATSCQSYASTRVLRSVLSTLFSGGTVPGERGMVAAREAVYFNLNHHRSAAWICPLVATIPVTLILGFEYDLDSFRLLNVIVATLLGISLSLLLMYFMTIPAVRPVIRFLATHGFKNSMSTPIERLQSRVVFCFSVILACSVTMIGAVAVHRLHDAAANGSITRISDKGLEFQLISIAFVAVVIGFFYSRLLAISVTSRVDELVTAMNAIQSGDLSARVEPHGNDEIEILGHRFNQMVSDLEILHTQLEQKVKSRTQQLQESLTKLQELDRMKTEFFSNVSHELRTPLMMILSPIRQVQSAGVESLDSRCQSLLDVAHNNGHRLLKQINQLLEFSKIEAGRANVVEGPVDLNEIARRLAFAAQPLAEQRGVQLDIDLDSLMPVTNSDEDKLDIILTNLVSNAIKFTSAGGHIWVKSQVVASPHHAGKRLLVSVEDTGRGIAEQDIPRLFQRFVQLDGSTSREYSGTGLGLALVRELIELLGGTVGVTSKLGVGTKFQIELPFKQPVEKDELIESPSGLIRPESFADLHSRRIDVHGGRRPSVSPLAQSVLIVDDNPQIRDLLVDLLSAEYNVITAEDGMHALAELEQKTPDLIISDVMMPYIDGQELCRRVKGSRDTANVPFILLTARSKTSMKIEGLDCGAEDYICKPFEDAELMARVRALLRVRRANVQLDQRNSELEKINKDLKQAQKQLVQAEKLSSLGQLVAGLAHEINNSINAVYNGVPAMKMRLKKLRIGLVKNIGDGNQSSLPPDLDMSFEKLDMLANVIADGAERTARIVSDMKTFAHPGRDRDEDFDLHRALDLCLNLSTKQSESKIHVVREYGEVPMIHGPYGQLHQVFLNLISNSVQAMKGGGTLTLHTEVVDSFITIRIRDTGTGIPEKIRNRIFEPFFTTKAPGVGTGLGLSISYSIVTKLGGTIECESELSHGTEFVMRIPLPVNLKSKESHDAIPMGMV